MAVRGSRLYLHERAFRDYGTHLRSAFSAYMDLCRRVDNWFTKGFGTTVIRWAAIAAGIGATLFYGLVVARVEYARSGRIFLALLNSALAALLVGVFIAIGAVVVYVGARVFAGSLGFLVVLGLGLAAGAASIVVFGLWLAMLFAWTALSFLSFLPLRLCHWLWLQIRKITYKCPYDDCRFRGLPIHICSCGAEYADLEPNFYGVFHHTCCHKDENIKLPTLVGRNRLPRLCGGCHRPLLHSSLGELREWPIFVMGAPNAGKTVFLTQAVRQLLKVLGERPGSIVRLDSEIQQREHAQHVRLLDSGQVLVKTAGDVMTALGLAVRIPKRLRALVYLFDKPGEYFQSMRQFGKMQGIEGLKGIVLLVDPFSLPGLEEHAHRLSGSLKPSETPFHTIASNLIHVVEQMLHGGEQRQCDVPLAVVLSKADAFPVSAYPFLAGLIGLDHQDPEGLQRSCRDALRKLGGDDSVRLLEQKFKTIRYFACTATGRMPDLRDTTPFHPAGVQQPLLWLLDGATGSSVLGKFGGR